MPATVQTPLPMNTNALYDGNLRVLPDSSLPDAGLGAQFTTDMPPGAVVGIYLNANTAKGLIAHELRTAHICLTMQSATWMGTLTLVKMPGTL